MINVNVNDSSLQAELAILEQPLNGRSTTATWLADESQIIWTLPACLLFQLALFTAIAYSRFIDNDEGLYLLAVKLVAHGKRPYLDFFFQQMPALPYVYALWSRIVGLSWTSARMLSVLCSVGIGGLLYWHVERVYCRKALAGSAVLLYALNNLVIAWHTVVKTYALSNLLLFGSYLVVFPSNKRRSGWQAFLGGLLFACAVDTRLYLIAAAPVLVASLYYSGPRTDRRQLHVVPFFAGFVFGLLPNLFFLLRAFDVYAFDNIGYHLIRHPSGALAGIRQKLETLLIITNIQGSYDGSGAQFILLCLPALATAWSRRPDRQLLVPFAMAVVLFITCLMPRPTFSQYFCVCVPYLVIVALNFIASSARPQPFRPFFQQVRALGLCAVLLYLLCGIVAVWNYGYWGSAVEGIGNIENAVDFRISTVRQVSKAVEQLVAKGEPVISFWPGYLVDCDCVPEDGTENEFALAISRKLTPTEAKRRKIITEPEVETLLQRHFPRAIIVRSRDGGGWGVSFRNTLQANGYKIVRSIAKADIYFWTPQ
jgi:hypothetical protein